MHVEGRWADNVYTAEGKEAHRRVDRLDHVLPDAEESPRVERSSPSEPCDGDDPPRVTRSVPLSSERLGITYDIVDDKRRGQVFKTLYGHGDHAQYSVFFCELNPRELVELRGKLRSAIHDIEDQIMILDLGPAGDPLDAGLECLGKPYRPTTAVLVV